MLLSESSTGQQSLLSQPVLPDVPVITGVEESRGAAVEQEELEFPHDLLPSLDFSSELNIWQSSLGYVEGLHIHTHIQTNMHTDACPVTQVITNPLSKIKLKPDIAEGRKTRFFVHVSVLRKRESCK